MKLFLCLVLGVISVAAQNLNFKVVVDATGKIPALDEAAPFFEFYIQSTVDTTKNYCISDPNNGQCVAFDVELTVSLGAGCPAGGASCATAADLNATYNFGAQNKFNCTVQPKFASTTSATAAVGLMKYSCDMRGLINDDIIVELSESMTIAVTNVFVGSTTQTYSVQTCTAEPCTSTVVQTSFPVTINGDESGAKFFVALTASSVDENLRQLNAEVSLSHDNAFAVDGVLGGQPGTDPVLHAQVGQDYTTKNFTIPASAAQAKTTVVLDIVDDLIQEFDETFSVFASANVKPSSWADSANVQATITDRNENVQVSMSGLSGNEQAATASSIQVVLTKGLSFGSDVTLNILTADGTATTADYSVATKTATMQSCTVTSGACPVLSYSFPVTIVDDQLVEVPETFSVTLKAGTGSSGAFTTTNVLANEILNIGSTAKNIVAIMQSDVTGAFTVNSNELATVTLSDATGAEQAGASLTFTVKVSHKADVDLNFVVTGTAGNADLTKDVTFETTLVTVTKGATESTFTVPIINDDVQEATETFTLALKASTTLLEQRITPVRAASLNGIGSITDDEKPSVTISDSKIFVNTESQADNKAKFLVTLSHKYDADVNVKWAAAGGNASPTLGDYSNSNLDAAILKDAYTGTIPVTIQNDNLEEAQETFTVTLNSVTSTGRTSPTIDRKDAVGTIDELGRGEMTTLSFKNTAIAVDESSVKVSLEVVLSHPTDALLTVYYSTEDGSATKGQDYTAVTDKVIEFNATVQGTPPLTTTNTVQTITVDILDDIIVEAAETFLVKLIIKDKERFQTVSFAGSQDTATVTINADAKDTATVSVQNAYANERDQVISFNLMLSNPVQALTKVTCTTSSTLGATEYNPATPGKILPDTCSGANHFDFRSPVSQESAVNANTFVPNTYVFLPLETTASLDIMLVNDNCQEATESFEVTLASVKADLDGTPATTGTKFLPGVTLSTTMNKAIGYITDNENAQVTLDQQFLSPEESAGTVRLNVGLTHNVAFAVTVDFAFNETGETNPASVVCTTTDTACQQDFKVLFPVSGAKQGGKLVFEAGDKLKPLVIRVEDDTVVEANEETVKLTLTSNAGALISTKYPTAANQFFTFTIKDNDQGEVFVADTSADEMASGKMDFKLSLSHQVQADVKVSYMTRDATCAVAGSCATADTDYVKVASTDATIPKFQKFTTVSVGLNDDSTQECDEKFEVVVSNLVNTPDWSTWGGKAGTPGLKIGKAGTGTINDLEPGFKFEGTKASAKEADPINWAVKLSHALSVGVSLQWKTESALNPTDPMVAKKGDRYIEAVSDDATELKFAAGTKDATTNLSVTLINDQEFSPDQSFTVILEDSKNGLCPGLFKSLPKLEGVVEDDEDASLTVEKNALTEGTEGDVVAILSHSVGNKHPLKMKVDWSYLYDNTTDARAIDFSTAVAAGTFEFTSTAAKERQSIKQTAVLDPTLVEGDEKFTLDFTPEKAFAKVKKTQENSTMPTITKNTKGFLTIAAPREYKETDEVYAFTVQLDTETSHKFSAELVCEEVDGVKFEIPADTKTIKFVGEKGETKSVRIPLANDQTVEFKKDFKGFPCKLNVEEFYKDVLTVKYPGDGTPANWNVMVEDDDVASLTCTSEAKNEGENITFTFKLSNPVDTDVKITYHTKAGTAKSPADFDGIEEAAAKDITIAKGATEIPVLVQTKDDELLEGEQTFMLVVKSIEAADRKVNILEKETVGTIKDTDKGVLKMVKTTQKVKEGEKLVFSVKIQDSAGKDLKTENPVTFSYTIDAGPMDRSPSTAKSSKAVFCVDFSIDHCDGNKLSDEKMKKGPLVGFVLADKADGTVELLTIKDGEVDYTNELSFTLSAVVVSGGELALDSAANLKDDATITDLDKITTTKVAKGGDVNEGAVMNAKVDFTVPYRRDTSVFFTSKSKKLVAGLDYPKFEKFEAVFPGGKKSHTFKWTVPDNQMVLDNFPFDIILFDGKKAEQNTVTFNRIDLDQITIEPDMVRSVVTNEEGGSGLSIVYRLVLGVRSPATDFTFTSGYQNEAADHLKVTFESKVQDFTINGKTYKGLTYAAAGTRTLWYDKSGQVVTAQTDTAFVARNFPVTLTLNKVVPKAIYVPELCRAPLTSGPKDSNTTNTHVYLSPGEINTFYPGTCFYYPDGTNDIFWNTELKATAGGPRVKITNPINTDMFVDLKVDEAAKRTVINLADQGETPYTLILWDQVDLDIVVADKLFLFECNRPGKKCCNLVQGESIVHKCNVDERVFRDAPVWAEDYDYDVSGIVRVSLEAVVPGLSRHCFGFAPAHHLYPDGFCLNVYVPEPPVIGYIPKQVVVQGNRITTQVEIMSGTVLSGNRSSGYHCRVACVKGCKATEAYVKEVNGTWMLTVQGDDVNYGDSQFIIIASDQYYGATSYPVDVRTIRAATLDNKGQCQ